MIPQVEPCRIPPVPETMVTNRDLVTYAIELMGELQKCSLTIEMLRKWIEEVNHGVGTK